MKRHIRVVDDLEDSVDKTLSSIEINNRIQLAIDGNSEEPVTESIFVLSNPTPTSVQIDARPSLYNGTAQGGAEGYHRYGMTTLRNFVAPIDISDITTRVPLTAGINVELLPDGITYRKLNTGNSWNSWFQSTNILIDPINENAAISWAIEDDPDGDGETGAQGTQREMAGLSATPSQNASYTSIDYAMYQVNATTVYVYEKGVNIGNFAVPMAVGDHFLIKCDSGVVSYYLISSGGSEQFIYESKTPATSSMYFKAALNRGDGSSGNSIVGDVRKHGALIAAPVMANIQGNPQELIRDEDVTKLLNLGLVVITGSVYSNIIAEKLAGHIFPSGNVHEVAHGYSGKMDQSIATI